LNCIGHLNLLISPKFYVHVAVLDCLFLEGKVAEHSNSSGTDDLRLGGKEGERERSTVEGSEAKLLHSIWSWTISEHSASTIEGISHTDNTCA